MLRSATAKLLRQSPQALRSGTQLRFAETQAAGKSLDWDQLQDFVTSDDGKRELSALQTSFNQLQSQSGPTKTVTINWDQYKGDVEPETLAIFQKAYSGLKFPNYDPAKDIEDTRAAFKPLYEQAEELAAFSEKRIKEINAELKALDTEKERMNQLTVDEELANHPELAKEIDKEISEGNFLP